MVHYYWVLRASGTAAELNNFSTLYLISLVMIVVSILPSAPSSAGVVHYGIYASLLLAASMNQLSLTPALKQNFALVSIYLHLSYFIPEIILGVFYLWKERKLLF